MDNPLKSRRGRLEKKIEEELLKPDPILKNIIDYIDEYETDNLNTIEKLKRVKKIEMARINGALRQSINAHGPITKELIGSASKRIYGSLLEPFKRGFKTFSIRDIVIGIIISSIFFYIFLHI